MTEWQDFQDEQPDEQPVNVPTDMPTDTPTEVSDTVSDESPDSYDESPSDPAPHSTAAFEIDLDLPQQPAPTRRVQKGQSRDPLARSRIRRMIAFDAELYDVLDQLAVTNSISVQWLIHVLLRRGLGMPDSADKRLSLTIKRGR